MRDAQRVQQQGAVRRPWCAESRGFLRGKVFDAAAVVGVCQKGLAACTGLPHSVLAEAADVGGDLGEASDDMLGQEPRRLPGPGVLFGQFGDAQCTGSPQQTGMSSVVLSVPRRCSARRHAELQAPRQAAGLGIKASLKSAGQRG
ncbi:hypothetical protein AB0N87_40810 [Streptomyces sp. NPDC093228]|jgi:hypothetical protein|uniref:hypothetical protein n=1 Tax=Streptomyces sp. NPDC093228 TaxID=3155070 RepID=UPI003435CC36